ncbi:MAG: 3-oxoacyl-[acyl-carrier-protein] synthase, KASII [uncultured Solirubrobacteraceae bacterium]|uniref:3-oxoacyl-[acyl-carrier-protein] synthase 2 n=1 Tax=uncultured Solirubrobacteraceae bacterium TaxID=1162706 RepID=A0A6J4S9J0_9ACTN|nr:MAG: 3-oxoacyl-[acyl-carrier-protein] synthase, KASII [uncultured Solirubrobacteraceae bacterium]
MSRIVVTGVGAVTPLGLGARNLFDRWMAGETGFEGLEAPCSDFEPTAHLSKKEARRADRFTQLAMVAGDEAMASAGWDDGLPYDPARIGCVVGTGIGGLGTMEHGHDMLRDEGPGKVPPLSVPLMMGNAAPGVLAMRHGLRGPSYGVVSACAAAGHAIGTAMRMIQHGEADAVMTGGAEAALTPLSRAAFAALDATSPTGQSRPFDRRRDGFVMGEGAGILILEDEERARERGATILGVIRGYGASSDAHHLTAPEVAGSGATAAMRIAIADAGLTPADIDYVNAHGTSTPLNDRAETVAIKNALGEHAHRVPVSSTKSAIGHLLGAAGAAEAIATLYALQERVAPPTLGYEEPEEDLDLDYVPEAKPLQVDGRPPIAMSNSFGFGGHNAVLVLEGA